jgi:hypothetical protein
MVSGKGGEDLVIDASLELVGKATVLRVADAPLSTGRWTVRLQCIQECRISAQRFSLIINPLRHFDILEESEYFGREVD